MTVTSPLEQIKKEYEKEFEETFCDWNAPVYFAEGVTPKKVWNFISQKILEHEVYTEKRVAKESVENFTSYLWKKIDGINSDIYLNDMERCKIEFINSLESKGEIK